MSKMDEKEMFDQIVADVDDVDTGVEFRKQVILLEMAAVLVVEKFAKDLKTRCFTEPEPFMFTQEVARLAGILQAVSVRISEIALTQPSYVELSEILSVLSAGAFAAGQDEGAEIAQESLDKHMESFDIAIENYRNKKENEQ